MNTVSGIFLAVALIFGGGYALDKIYLTIKMAAVERIQRGMPSLEKFNRRMTCSYIDAHGIQRALKSCGRRR